MGMGPAASGRCLLLGCFPIGIEIDQVVENVKGRGRERNGEERSDRFAKRESAWSNGATVSGAAATRASSE
jgi:hypothetical protein